MPAPHDTRTLVDELLEEQQRLTAIDRFAQRLEREAIPAQAKYYRDLIPLTTPQPGQQYAFEIHLDKCSGCKACVSACHSLNGLDDGESWREVGLLFSADWRQPFQQNVTTACHHCLDPACLNGCPVLAYDKDPLTGIVRHLDDQCIGCQYCVMKCPYEVPKYSPRRGIVRKCDMCASRLAVAEAPACVQACPHEAIRITISGQPAIAAAARRGEFLPASPDPGCTLPSTHYTSASPLPVNLLAGDHARIKSAAPHLPLVFMLVLTQLSVGASVAAIFAPPACWLALVTADVGILALAIGALHLGRPLQAWRAFLGWRKSWFSRELIVFSAFLPLAVTTLVVSSFPTASQPDWRNSLMLLRLATAAVGLIGVACSAMIYVDTRRDFWRAPHCFAKFLGTTMLLGAAITLALCVPLSHPMGEGVGERADAKVVAALLVAITAAKLSFEHRIFRHLVDEETPVLTPLNKTACLLAGQLGLAVRARIACGVLGGMLLPILLLLNSISGGLPTVALAWAVLFLCFGGELLERYLFFAAVAPTKMPGAIAP